MSIHASCCEALTSPRPFSALLWWQEWQELEAAKDEGDAGAAGKEQVPALLQMAANQVQQDESLTEVR